MAYFLQNRHIMNSSKAVFSSFSTMSDTDLANAIAGYYSGKYTLDDFKNSWKVGDKRTISLSAIAAPGKTSDLTGKGVTETHVAQKQEIVILDFNHDKLASSVNGKTKALLSVQILRMLSNGTTAEQGEMNHFYFNTSTNTAVSVTTGGWGSSDRRTWCNDYFKPALPTYIQNLIKKVSKQYCSIYSSSTISTASDYVWLPSENELYNRKTYSPAKEGTQYEYYATVDNRVKYSGNATSQGSENLCWLRSLVSSRSTAFCNTSKYGDVTGYSDSGAWNGLGISPAFCL